MFKVRNRIRDYRALGKASFIMKITRVFIPTAVAASVAACSTSVREPVALPPVDSSVSGLSPEGSYAFTGGLTLSTGSRVTETESFVNFGTADDGAECAADYTINNTKANASDFSHGAADNASNGELCSIGVMPRFMATRDDGVLVSDTARLLAAICRTFPSSYRWYQAATDLQAIRMRQRTLPRLVP